MSAASQFEAFDANAAADAVQETLVTNVFMAAGALVSRVNVLVKTEAPKAPQATLHLLTELDRLVDNVISRALTGPGRDRLLTKQPLALGGAPSVEPSEQEEMVTAIVSELSGKSPSDQKVIVARFREALNGTLDDTDDLRRQLHDAQKKLEDFKPFEAFKADYDKVADRADRARRLQSAKDVFNNIVKGSTTTADPALAKAQSDLATANSDLTRVKNELADAKKTLTAAMALLKFFKARSKLAVLSNKRVTITFDEPALKPDQKVVWENV